jgi:hypothetical protein
VARGSLSTSTVPGRRHRWLHIASLALGVLSQSLTPPGLKVAPAMVCRNGACATAVEKSWTGEIGEEVDCMSNKRRMTVSVIVEGGDVCILLER